VTSGLISRFNRARSLAACPLHLLRKLRFECLGCLLLASLAHGQTAPAVTPPAAGDTLEVSVGPDDPVITINGFCADAPPSPGNVCKTVITRAQFEKLTEALQPGMSQSLRLNVANAYARNLRMSAAAEKRGLDKTPAFEEEMRYARMQMLSQDLTRTLQADANDITDAELEDYYKKNQSTFEQATFARIFVPRAKQADLAQVDEEKMTKVAIDLHDRAVNGEDPDKLQIEAYADAGFPRTTPNTKMEKVRRATLPPQHETVLDVKPGEVSKVFSDPGGAKFIYKMITKETPTLEEVKTEIRTAISSQRYHDSMKSFQGDVVFSDAYFNPTGNPAAQPQRNRREKRIEPPAQPNQDHH
jgi:hypothetical protein